MSNCENVKYATSCDEGELNIELENTGSSAADVFIDLPAGTQIFDQAGEVVYTIPGQPDKTKMRIPAAGYPAPGQFGVVPSLFSRLVHLYI